MVYSDAELERMLTDVESDLVERKESLAGDAPSKVREAICAFANDLAGHGKPGVIFLGARDDGSPAGLAVTDGLLRQLADMKSDGNIVPPPTIAVEKRTSRGFELAVMTVMPADAPPVSYRGRIWIRVGPRRAIATAQDERVLSERRRYRDRPFDAHPVASATLRDLSRTRFEEEYPPGALAREILAANERSYEERLAAAKMISSPDRPIPTVAGILVLGTRPSDFIPGGYVQFLKVEGVSLSDAIGDEAPIHGTISDQIRRVEEKLEALNQTAVDVARAPTEHRAAIHPWQRCANSSAMRSCTAPMMGHTLRCE